MGFVTSRPSLFLRDIDPALRLFEIRRLLSDAYQKMFYSSRNPELISPVPTWELCATAEDWLSKASEYLPTHTSTQFRLEYYFTLIILLSPSNICPTPSLFSRLLTLEAAVEFISGQHEIIFNSSSAQPLVVTYIDMQRTSLVSNKLVDFVQAVYRDVFHGPIPDPPSVPQGTPPPPQLTQIPHDRPRFQHQVLTSIYAAHSIFEYVSTRWGTRTLLEEFVSRAVPARSMLEQEQHLYRAPSSENVAQPDPGLNVRQLATTETMAQDHTRQPSSGYNISP